jgi:rhombotail lipoprotein
VPPRTRPLLLAALLCGCHATGFDRDALRERLNDGTVQSPDAAIADARAARPQLKFPCRVAVYLKPPGVGDWRWTPEDKAAMETWAAALKQEGVVSEVIPLPEMLAGKGDLKELRLAAAKCGADVLFVVRGADQTDKYLNAMAVLNLTVVGGYVVPASHRDSLFMMEGLLVDVDNEYVYAGVQAEGVGKIVRPTFLVEDKDAVSRAKAKAVAQFGDEVLRRMRALAGRDPGAAR